MSERPERLVHHELCFGCGQQNLFGLQLELERRADGGVAGRFFVKQDHQGASGHAHDGVIAAALAEAISLAAGAVRSERLELDFHASAPLGAFVHVEAEAGDEVATATASGPEGPLASAKATLGSV
jgi:acyl-coenzyme A thioesterase PaaI-like protein